MMEMLKADTNLDCIDLLFHVALTSPILRLACLAARSGCPEARRGTRAPGPERDGPQILVTPMHNDARRIDAAVTIDRQAQSQVRACRRLALGREHRQQLDCRAILSLLIRECDLDGGLHVVIGDRYAGVP